MIDDVAEIVVDAALAADAVVARRHHA